jgi:hypothetical protein
VSDQVQPSDQRPAQLLRDALRSRVARFTSGLTCVLASVFASESVGKSLIVGALVLVRSQSARRLVDGPGSWLGGSVEIPDRCDIGRIAIAVRAKPPTKEISGNFRKSIIG